MISETVVAKFPFTVSKSTGLAALTNQGVTFGSCFVDDFAVGTDSVFIDRFLVNMGCEHFRFHTLPLEGF
jgi:hypothetical protein